MPVEHAALSMTAGGVVSETLVKEGDAVTAGQVIFGCGTSASRRLLRKQRVRWRQRGRSWTR